VSPRRRTSRTAALPPPVWKRIAGAPHRLLMLDYDGTLAPLRIRRDEALPVPGAREVLVAIARDRGTTVAVISGRPLAELEALLGRLPVVRAAEHGGEVRWPDGRRLVHAIARATTLALADAAEAAETSLRAGTIERKRTSIVLHTRGLDAAAARLVEIAGRALWAPFAARRDLRLDRIDGGIELRARGRDKGVVVRWLLGESPPRTLPVYIGDDATDEDAFRAVGARGVAIRVGTADRPSAARLRLGGPDDVVSFLEAWSARLGRTRHPERRSQ
jgi:trehalose 6-phosphate phosphatase